MKAKSTNKQAQKQFMNPILLTPTQLKLKHDRLLVVDIRGWWEYWIGHIAGAQRFNHDRILKEIPKNRAIAVTCLSGHRSNLAAQRLVAQGYSQIYNLQGGLLAWQGAGYPVQRGFHPYTIS